MCKPDGSAQAQRERCDHVAKLVTQYQAKQFSASGAWVGAGAPPPVRERLYFALAFLRGGNAAEVQKANAIVQATHYVHCHFSPMIAIQLLTKYSAKLEAKSQAALLDYLKAQIDAFAQSDLDYVGVNDNFPSMATYVLVAGGQLLNRPELVSRGAERLRQFQALLTRRGVASEYNSPTYSPIQLLAMAELGEIAQDAAVRQIATACEQRVWADCLGHLHPETCHVAGPYSRAYADDSAAYTGLMRCALYAVLGEALPIHVCNTLLACAEGQHAGYAHNGAAFTQINTVWLTDTTYHCPPSLLALALHKQYPYEMTATTEFSSSTDAPAQERPEFAADAPMYDEYPAGTGLISTYMTEDYALGVASHAFHSGTQTDAFHLLYRRRTPALQQQDIGTVYARYLVNEKHPEPEMVILEDEGRKLGVQHQNTAMLLYRPKTVRQSGITSLRLALIVPVPRGEAVEVWLGDKKMDGDAIEAAEPYSVYLRDGAVHMAFHPLLLTNHGRESAVRVVCEEGFLTVSFYNYAGPARSFTPQELRLTGSGFAAEVGSAAQGDFAQFRAQAAAFTVRDSWQANLHSRFTVLRKTSYQKGDLCLACEYSPATEGVKQLTINGLPPQRARLRMTGVDCGSLPFLSE